MAGQLVALRQGPPIFLSVHPWGRTVGVGHREELKCSKPKAEEPRSYTNGWTFEMKKCGK
ncbi:MAG: hypothetical protein NPIRA06_08270 [Nitrospirales bacterium]|nr:MAG: hypothetical protein NPIRA06_08270 [Nitrospirales bacterium]